MAQVTRVVKQTSVTCKLNEDVLEDLPKADEQSSTSGDARHAYIVRVTGSHSHLQLTRQYPLDVLTVKGHELHPTLFFVQ